MWEIISREKTPEEWALMQEHFKKCDDCERRGHGQLVVDSDGLMYCRDCEQGVLDCNEDDDEDGEEKER